MGGKMHKFSYSKVFKSFATNIMSPGSAKGVDAKTKSDFY